MLLSATIGFIPKTMLLHGTVGLMSVHPTTIQRFLSLGREAALPAIFGPKSILIEEMNLHCKY